jgi:diacylglycerol kinase
MQKLIGSLLSKMSKFKNDNILKSVGSALQGIGLVLIRERNFRIQNIAALLVICLGLYVKLSKIEWIIIGFTVLIVMVLEMINTALELTVDLVTKKKRMRARLAKDIAAGAVLLASFWAIVIGILIFYNKLI